MKKSPQEIVRRTRGRDTSISYTLTTNVENLALKQTTKTLQPGSANDDNYEDRRAA